MEKLTHTNRRGEQGQAVIELALTLPLLLLVLLGIFDFGLMLQRYEIVTNAAREGARAGVLPNFCSAPPFSSCSNAKTRAESYLNTGGLNVGDHTCGGSKVANTRCVSVASSTATIPAVGTAPAITVNQVTVTVEYDHEHVFVGPIRTLFGGSTGITRLTAVSSMRLE